VGVVFQANRRDDPEAVPIEVVREAIAPTRIALVESTAPDGTGVREAFVFAVRLALDRVRAVHLRARGPRASGLPDACQTLQLLKELETSGDSGGSRGNRDGLPRPPSADVMSGMVWPPVEGRIILREATKAGCAIHASPQGDCWAELGDAWHAHSSGMAVFAELERGREALIDWARLHASAQGLLSTQRCIVLAETGDGRWRLWQIVRREPSLRELFGDGSEPVDPQGAAALRLASAGRRLAEARAMCAAAALPLPCSLDTIGISDVDRPIFVGLVPHERGGAESPARGITP
jgi:hypothetical protein